MGSRIIEDLGEVINWRVTLSPHLSQNGVFPAIDIHRSGTLRSERLRTPEQTSAAQSFVATLTDNALENAKNLIDLTKQ